MVTTGREPLPRFPGIGRLLQDAWRRARTCHYHRRGQRKLVTLSNIGRPHRQVVFKVRCYTLIWPLNSLKHNTLFLTDLRNPSTEAVSDTWRNLSHPASPETGQTVISPTSPNGSLAENRTDLNPVAGWVELPYNYNWFTVLECRDSVDACTMGLG